MSTHGSRPAGGASGAAPHQHDHHHGHDHGHDHDHAHHHHHHHHHHHGPAREWRADALIRGRGLTSRRGGRVLLDHVDIEIAPKEIVTVIGPNGAGKTTLVRLLLGLVEPDGGVVERRAGLRVGYAPQKFESERAIPITVDRFLRLNGRRGDSEIAGVLEEVGAARVRQRQLHDLSGGELQRVILARALLRQPELLVLDEPARGVDYVGEAELYDLIGRLRGERGLGVLLVSHDLHVVMARSDHVVCLNRHVCCEGVPDTVAVDPEYKKMFGAAALAFYRHHHDHAHDLAGNPRPVPGTGEDNEKGG